MPEENQILEKKIKRLETRVQPAPLLVAASLDYIPDENTYLTVPAERQQEKEEKQHHEDRKTTAAKAEAKTRTDPERARELGLARWNDEEGDQLGRLQSIEGQT